MSNDPSWQTPNHGFNPLTYSSTGAPNPYAPTGQGGLPPMIDPNDSESIRKSHLSHEASVQSIGCLYYLGAAFGIPMGLFYLGTAVSGGFIDEGVPVAIMVVVGFFVLGMGLAQGFMGYGLRRLLPWARIGGIVISAFGLLGFPIGTLISAYCLYLLVSKKGEVVFSDHYRQVISQTPHIVYKTSIIVKVFLGILVALILVGVISALFAA
jgi:hypothetical protein